MHDTVVVIPAYNEAERLDVAAFKSYAAATPGVGLLFVNDGSTDATAEAVEKLRDDMPVTRVDHDTNRGLGETIRTGLLHALEGADDRDIIVTMDSDNTHTPGLIARMVRGIREGRGRGPRQQGGCGHRPDCVFPLAHLVLCAHATRLGASGAIPLSAQRVTGVPEHLMKQQLRSSPTRRCPQFCL